MALSDLERKRCEMALLAFMAKRRPPPHIRPRLDLAFRFVDQSVEIVEIRPCWDRPQEKMEHSVAKATYVKTQKVWRVFWQRADLKWHRYEPSPEANSLDEFLSTVDRDEYGCFFG
jgi:DUF3024 family protein